MEGSTSGILGLIGVVGDAVEAIVDVVGSTLTSVGSIFWDGSAPTFLGSIVIVSAAAPLVYWGINLFTNFIGRIFRRGGR